MNGKENRDGRGNRDEELHDKIDLIVSNHLEHLKQDIGKLQGQMTIVLVVLPLIMSGIVMILRNI